MHLDPGTSLPCGAHVEAGDGGGEVNNNEVEVEVAITDDPSHSEDRLAEKISQKVFQRLGIGLDKSMKTVIAEAVEESVGVDIEAVKGSSDIWLESTNHFICEVCSSLLLLRCHATSQLRGEETLAL